MVAEETIDTIAMDTVLRTTIRVEQLARLTVEDVIGINTRAIYTEK